MNELKVLLIDDIDNKKCIVGIANATDYIITSGKYVYASKNTLSMVSELLKSGEQMYIKPNINHKEVMPEDIEVIRLDGIEKKRNIALMEILKLINKNIFAVNIIDAMDFLNCYMKLLNAGIFITDSNREDKYFEIIEAAQENEEPAPLTEDSTFEAEQAYIDAKKKYDISQENLVTLEKYLNAYDKLTKINFTNNLLNGVRDRITAAATEKEIDDALSEGQAKIKGFFYTNPLQQHEV